MAELVSLRRVSKNFSTAVEEVVALDEVSLDIAEGDFVCVQGPSGSGKTTLLNVVAGLEVADSGEVVVAGQHLEGMGESKRAHHRLHHVGIVFQDDNLIPELTAQENIELPLQALGIPLGATGQLAREALDKVSIGQLADRRPAEMSGGQRQRVGIARALAGGRKLLLADEPTGALDSATSRDLFSLLQQLSGDGYTVLLVSHSPEAVDYASRAFTMTDGRLAAV
ncbi:ABC transporter ATP-binding protein [Aestuariimicrobium sp. p3-SID1156]|uniref:ABC transporter ATP-binding protein n=1 Tax=Aestuariimicrobium sp. p3-SID1156 TaxID=2916038 RepID=UPI00223C4D82|nr:ABC transporter ATP-binding protein [Aestuariimicrobium sp. p3-SID1156]MCT1460037.1 ABC transporter ATP-binding protein [Aestuariimicrobium sp. p3-SID1156]